ncbi:MAG: hypothetical protein F9K40_06575 [Kofleriaceae bacterium]|nr:MAG: hypothetical protein F9K40_06575 [Kofleriaceae bacterium]
MVAGGLTISPGGAVSAPTVATTGDVAVGGNLGVTGAATVGSTLGVAGAATVGGALGVTGPVTAGGLLTASAGVTVPSGQNAALQGNATVGGTLGVAGATTLSGALGVSGALTASGGLTVPTGQNAALQGNATVGGTLGVTGATTVGGTLGVTGAATIGSTLGVSGAVTASGGLTVPSGQTAALQGNATVGGTLGVTGATTVGGTLGVTGGATVGSLTVASNQHVIVTGTGDYKHGDRTLQLPASAGTPVNASSGMSGHPATSSTGWRYSRQVGAAAQCWFGPVNNQDVYFPITLNVGDRIKSVSARIQDTGGIGNTISMYLHRTVTTSSFSSGSALVGSVTSPGNGSIQTLTLSGLTQMVNSFELYNVVLRANGGPTPDFTNHRIAGVQVTYDRP